MQHPADRTTPNPVESTVAPIAERGGLNRIAANARRIGRRPSVSIGTDARLRASHVRSAAFRTELY